MIELFDKKFVHFMWDNELEGKKCFLSEYIDTLRTYVEIGSKSNLHTVIYSEDKRTPFESAEFGFDFSFAYYDPNYEVKKAFNEGKEIQFKDDVIGEWRPAYNPCWDLNTEYQAKPEEEKRIAYLARKTNGSCYLSACAESCWKAVQKEFGAKTKLFVGTESEVNEWFESRQKFAEVIKAWEDGKDIQFRRTCFSDWISVFNPLWDVNLEYRVKPEEKEETKDKDKMNPIQEKKMRRYNLNLGDWDELKEMAVKMFKGIATLNEKFAEKISKGGFVTQDDWKMMNGLWQTFNYTNDDKKLCKEDLHHLFTDDDPDEEFVEIKAEEVKEKKYRPYKSVNEFLQDFQERFGIKYNPSWSMPTIWLWDKELDRKCLVRDFESDKVMCGSTSWTMEELFDRWTYLDGSLVGMEVKE